MGRREDGGHRDLRRPASRGPDTYLSSARPSGTCDEKISEAVASRYTSDGRSLARFFKRAAASESMSGSLRRGSRQWTRTTERVRKSSSSVPALRPAIPWRKSLRSARKRAKTSSTKRSANSRGRRATKSSPDVAYERLGNHRLHFTQDFGEETDHLVAALKAEAVVKALKAVQVDVGKGKRLSAGEEIRKRPVDQVVSRKTGKRVREPQNLGLHVGEVIEERSEGDDSQRSPVFGDDDRIAQSTFPPGFEEEARRRIYGDAGGEDEGVARGDFPPACGCRGSIRIAWREARPAAPAEPRPSIPRPPPQRRRPRPTDRSTP